LERYIAEANYAKEKLEQSLQCRHTEYVSEEGRPSSNYNIVSLVLKVQIDDS